jgi:hypothetical protein
MLEGSERDGGDVERRPQRPLWLAGLAALLTASLLAWIIILAWGAYDYARLDEGHMFEDDRQVRPAAPFTLDWWPNALLAFSRIAAFALAYALPLMAIIAFVERGSDGLRFGWPMAGAAAMAPLICAVILLAAGSHFAVPPLDFIAPILLLLLVGMAGGAAAAAVRNGPRP